MGETPGPIPNPEAKTHSADGTAFVRMWESRTPPDNNKKGRGPTPPGAGPPSFNTQNAKALRRPVSAGFRYSDCAGAVGPHRPQVSAG